MNNLPAIACDLSALDEDEHEAHRKNGEAVFEAVSEIRESSNGYKFRLPADTQIIKQAGAFIARERLCCPFFEFTLIIESEKDPVWLKLGGREGVKEFMEENLLPQLSVNRNS